MATTTETYDPEARLKELGLELPSTRQPVGNYCGAVQVGALVFVAGHGPFQGPKQLYRGKLGAEVSIEEGKLASQATILSSLASLKALIGDLKRVRRIVRLFGMVNAVPDFEKHPAVIDGASDVLTKIFGERGVHARCAIGHGSLPFNMPVEIEMTVQIDE